VASQPVVGTWSTTWKRSNGPSFRENAHDYGVPHFQIEKNVQALSLLPLWGLEFLTPTNGIFEDCLDPEIQSKSLHTTERDILENFVPILTTLVKCSRAIKLDHTHIDEASRALVELNDYFESGRHWGDVWNSDIVKETWQYLWLNEDADNMRPISKWLDAERPTLAHLQAALDMWHHYLFVFSIPVPEKIPDVFQVLHHFAAASYGVLCKLKRNCNRKFHPYSLLQTFCLKKSSKSARISNYTHFSFCDDRDLEYTETSWVFSNLLSPLSQFLC
jgi:hypothetical protein